MKYRKVGGDKKLICDKCKLEVRKFKFIHKINGKRLCGECYKENKKNHREKTIEVAGIKEELKQLDKKRKIEYFGGIEGLRKANRDKYHQRNPQARYNRKEADRLSPELNVPKIKGSKISVKPIKTNCYLSFQERQVIFRILLKNGIDEETAKDRIKELINIQQKIREHMKQQNKSEEEISQKIKLKQQKMLEELYNY